jgi:hypothetical protein
MMVLVYHLFMCADSGWKNKQSISLINRFLFHSSYKVYRICMIVTCSVRLPVSFLSVASEKKINAYQVDMPV